MSEVEKREAEAALVEQFAALPVEMQQKVLCVLQGMTMTLDALPELTGDRKSA